MNRIFKTAILSAAVAATTLSALPAAEAGERWRRYDRHHHNYNRNNGGELLAAGALGLMAGALIAGSANRSQPVYDYDYYEPQPRPRAYRSDYYRPAPQPRATYSSGYAMEPWTPQWYQYCSDRYRSFKPKTGTFTGYDGVQRFCVAG